MISIKRKFLPKSMTDLLIVAKKWQKRFGNGPRLTLSGMITFWILFRVMTG